MTTRAVAAAALVCAASMVSCRDGEATDASASGDGSTSELDGGGGPTPAPSMDSSVDSAPETPDGGGGSIPGAAIAFPLDVALITRAKPLNIDVATDVIISSQLQYKTAYVDGGLQDTGAYFRFTQRTHTALAELPSEGIRVWWRKLSDDGKVGNYICRETNQVSGIRTLDSNGMAGSETEPDGVWRNQCSWTLWKHPTENAWYIRAPEGKSTAEGGTFVVESHGTASEAYRIRVDGSSIGLAPFFRFHSKI